ncbi:hypothetical protein [Ramlibacter tataouinensis]|nr:hypothetical protein [Ramlibacter tataouinensis]
MELQYLVFDFSDEESGRGSFDALASVLPDRLPALLAELAAVLQWAHANFGPAAALQDEGDWDYELQGTLEPEAPLQVVYDSRSAAISLAPSNPRTRVTLALTLSGVPAFCEAFRRTYGVVD